MSILFISKFLRKIISLTNFSLNKVRVINEANKFNYKFKISLNFSITFLGILLLSSCVKTVELHSQKINGVNLVSFKNKPSDTTLVQFPNVLNANWVSLCPFTYLKPNDPNFQAGVTNWYGDTEAGLVKTIALAREKKMQILLKPHFYVLGTGWAGDFELTNEGWKIWENNYQKYIISLAKLAQENKIEMFCIGTELKKSVQQREKFWFNLIDSVKKIYSGKLTYGANWDEYQQVPFWHKLDIIGIDAYFPLVKTKTPRIKSLKREWSNIKDEIKDFSSKNKKRVLFTEFGYRSIHKTAWKQWEFEKKPLRGFINTQGQTNAYQALFEMFWQEKWLAGGFIWKWYLTPDSAEDVFLETDYTPQNKPVIEIIKQYFK